MLGPELGILCDVPVSDIQRVGGSLLAEAVTRLRQGAVVREAGYDGEYGTVALFAPGEIGAGPTLFDLAELELLPVPRPRAAPEANPDPGANPDPRANAEPAAEADAGSEAGVKPGVDVQDGAGVRAQAGAVGGPRSEAGAFDDAVTPSGPFAGLLEQLDADQRAAARADSPLMIVAGPGTGKTRTLTYRIAYQLAASGRPGTSCLAVTFTRRAAEEMRTRLEALSRLAAAPHATPATPAPAPSLADVTVTTFHGLGLLILRELHDLAGLPADFQVADEAAMLAVAAELAGSDQAGRDLLTAAAGDQAARESLVKELTARGLVDFDGLIELAVALLSADPEAAGDLRGAGR